MIRLPLLGRLFHPFEVPSRFVPSSHHTTKDLERKTCDDSVKKEEAKELQRITTGMMGSYIIQIEVP